MKKIEICLSPELLHLYKTEGKNVLIADIFRATTSMISALGNSVTSVTPFKNIDECLSMKSKGYVTAGEKDGKKADGFDLGNSPLSYLKGKYANQKISMTTTNGTLAIESVKENAKKVLIGAFINLSATISFLKKQPEDLLILCAGWKGKFNLEDSLYSGAIAYYLEKDYQSGCDSVFALKSLFACNQGDIKGFLANASHTKRLQNQGIEEDIDFCLSVDLYNIIGILYNSEIISQEILG